jgi:YHS domain-containing protein
VTKGFWLAGYGVAVAIVGLWAGARLFADAAAEPAEAASSEEIIAGLEEFNLLIGEWRGVGIPKRGSPQGAWQETGECVWEITKQSTGIRWKAKSGKLWISALIGYVPKEKLFTVKLDLPDEKTAAFTGKFDKQKLVVESQPNDAGEVQRLTLTILNENRWTALFEKRAEKQTFYNRVAEIGFQRQGTTLAASDGNGPECVVTGGKGTIAVAHKGKTYYVCCTGCRDAFNDDPEAILAAYAEKKKAKKK